MRGAQGGSGTRVEPWWRPEEFKASTENGGSLKLCAAPPVEEKQQLLCTCTQYTDVQSSDQRNERENASDKSRKGWNSFALIAA